MREITPFRAIAKKRARKPRIAKDQPTPHTCTAEKDMVTVILDDGTSKTISGKNLEIDMEYKDGVPYLVVKKKQ